MPVPYQKHGRRHAANGEDPIPTTAGSSPKFASVLYGQQSHTISGGLIRFRWNQLDTNDTSVFSLTSRSSDTIIGSGQWADWLSVSEAGLYQIFSRIDHSTSAFASNTTTIIPTYYDGFGDAALEQLTGYDWDTGDGLTLGSQYVTGVGWDHSGLWCVSNIWHDPALDGASPLKLALRIGTTKTGSVTVDAAMWVIQLISGTSPTVTRETL